MVEKKTNFAPIQNEDEISKNLPYILAGIIFGVLALNYLGVIDLAGALDPNSENFLLSQNTGYKCFKHSTEMSTPCCTVQNGVEVSAVYAFSPQCECPLDTVDYQFDVVANGVKYRTCDCQCP